MIYNLDMIRAFYATYEERIKKARISINHPMTYAEKVLYAHLANNNIPQGGFVRGKDYAQYNPNRVCMQDATAQMAILQFMNARRESTADFKKAYTSPLLWHAAGKSCSAPL